MLMCFLDGSVGISFLLEVWDEFSNFGMQLWGCGMNFWIKSQENLEISKINLMHLFSVC